MTPKWEEENYWPTGRNDDDFLILPNGKMPKFAITGLLQEEVGGDTRPGSGDISNINEGKLLNSFIDSLIESLHSAKDIKGVNIADGSDSFFAPGLVNKADNSVSISNQTGLFKMPDKLAKNDELTALANAEFTHVILVYALIKREDNKVSGGVGGNIGPAILIVNSNPVYFITKVYIYKTDSGELDSSLGLEEYIEGVAFWGAPIPLPLAVRPISKVRHLRAFGVRLGEEILRRLSKE